MLITKMSMSTVMIMNTNIHTRTNTANIITTIITNTAT